MIALIDYGAGNLTSVRKALTALGAEFEGTEFDLPERNAHGAARRMQVDAAGKITLDDVSFSTCPATNLAWQLKAKNIELDTRARNGTTRGERTLALVIVVSVIARWSTEPANPQAIAWLLTGLAIALPVLLVGAHQHQQRE